MKVNGKSTARPLANLLRGLVLLLAAVPCLFALLLRALHVIVLDLPVRRDDVLPGPKTTLSF